MDLLIELMPLIIIFLFISIGVLSKSIKKVPKNTVYIIDKHTHYHKTVKNGYFFLNPFTHTITTKISLSPITTRYVDTFETEDGKMIFVSFFVTYSAKNMEDILYNLEKVRRSIDDILKSCMYATMLALNSKIVSKTVLNRVFKYNLESQAMSFGLNIHNFDIIQLSIAPIQTKPFKPHKNYSDSPDPIQYNKF
jgi:regulator of protease activity HflC (stomatin/prohibitin superfamily)